MKKIDKDELFGHVSEFLKKKGLELQEGSYARTIQKGCQVLADTINLSQQAMGRAKVELEKKLDQARQVIHEKTAPKAPPMQSLPVVGTQPTGAKGSAPKRPLPRRMTRRVPKRSNKSSPGKGVQP